MTRKYSVEQMREFAMKADNRNNADWLAEQDERKRLESEFHDKKHDELEEAKANKAMDTYEAVYTNRKYYGVVQASNRYFQNWIDTECKGKIVLDYCCGVGGSSIKAAKAGADLVIGIDISESSLRVAQQRAEDAGVADRIVFVMGDAENTQLPKGSIERGICSGVLHHLDLAYAVPELNRVAAPGAKIIAGEALDYNPAIKLYRMRTPDIRTEWEKAHILSLKDITFIRRFMPVNEMKFWHITAIAAPHLPGFFEPILQKVDRLLERVPFVRRMAWMFYFVMEKPKEA